MVAENLEAENCAAAIQLLARTMPPPDAVPPAHTAQNDRIASSEGSQLLKKTYLSLLPPLQIIEICLAFEPHAPLHVRNTVWPTDLDAAIHALKTRAPPIVAASPGTPQALDAPHPPPSEWDREGDGDPPMGSLRAPTAGENQTASSKAASQEPAPARPSPNLSASASASPAPVPVHQAARSGQPSSSSPSTSTAADPHAAHATKSSTPQPASLHPPVSYSYTPYGYAYQAPSQSAYPHAPYYPSPPPPAHAYAPAYPYYAPPPGYPSAQPHAVHQPYAPAAQPRPPQGASTSAAGSPAPPLPTPEDLPSYEEMIVEALLDVAELDGAVPKELFAWMAARYPLQTNFRPSASQALQKAYKRGRLEKRAGGRYRVNPAWEGGATTKRTTRRPQTLAQTTLAVHHPPQPPSSPFTHAPLAHPHHPPYPPPNGGPAPGQPARYHGYPYGYPAGYPYPSPQYQHYSPPPSGGTPGPYNAGAASTAATPPAAPAAAAGAPADKPAEAADEHHELWEATQHILNAINFGVEAQAAAAHPPPVVADAGVGAGAQRTMLTDEERAALQTQLSLLGAQLAEIAEDADAEDADVAMHTALDVDQFEEILGGAHIAAMVAQRDGQAAGTDSDEDEDMEMVEVPTFSGRDALRT